MTITPAEAAAAKAAAEVTRLREALAAEPDIRNAHGPDSERLPAELADGDRQRAQTAADGVAAARARLAVRNGSAGTPDNARTATDDDHSGPLPPRLPTASQRPSDVPPGGARDRHRVADVLHKSPPRRGSATSSASRGVTDGRRSYGVTSPLSVGNQGIQPWSSLEPGQYILRLAASSGYPNLT